MDTNSAVQAPHPTGKQQQHEKEEWEEWESEGAITPIEPTEQILIDTSATSANPNQASRSSVSKSNRYSTGKIKRLKSRHRQKAQNAKAGIKLITDMSVLRRQNPSSSQIRTPNGRPVKFVDAAALRALEGEPTSASVGNWNWLRKARGQSPAAASPQNTARATDQELSPEDRPIVIGISLPSDVADSRQISPQTADTNTPANPFSFNNPWSAPKLPAAMSTTTSLTSSQAKSVWSPDTPDTAHSFKSPQNPSNPYSKAAVTGTNIPVQSSPLSAGSAGPKKSQHQRLISLELGGNGGEDDDGGTPCTLFEEDGIPSPLRQAKSKAAVTTPDSAGSRTQGWWDHVVTPFTEKRLTFSSQKHRLESPKEEDEDRLIQTVEISEKQKTPSLFKPSPIMIQAPIVRVPTPRRTPSPRLTPAAQNVPAPTPPPASAPVLAMEPPSPRPAPGPENTVALEKPRIVVTDETSVHSPPPPYSPQRNPQQAAPVRYRAVFPPSHPLYAQFPPSPGPVSPGLAAAMTSQGATQMAEIDPSPSSQETPLPARPNGAYLPAVHVQAAPGRANKVERQRRRHEKEDVVARRAGGLWRGRGCIPATGCFGRSGREGRKKRRVWFGVISGIIALIILGVVLGVVLKRPAAPQDIENIWVNLTDFPPMPTGVLTVVAPENSVARSSCTKPSTLWSCALPKEQHESVAPFKPNQPTVIMQIQWDNSSRNEWNVPNGTPPSSISKRASGLVSYASSMIRARQAVDFKPVPSPPKFEEMWFLGNTTDDVKSEDKAGEPTPFYISLLDSVEDPVDSPKLKARQNNKIGNVSVTEILPQPELEDDGTPKPAVLLPQAKQQPVRLYDRGLPTEHYGFYMHYKRTLYLRSVTVLNDTTEGDVPLDENGGARKTEADFLTTWGQTRLLVRIWTRTLESNTSSLLKPDGGSGGETKLVRPGTMPYPVTVTMDTHGGDPEKKVTWMWPMDSRQKLDLNNPKLLVNNMAIGGTHINPRGSGDKKLGGFDGGTGGCKCEWVNWVQTSQ